MKRWLKSSISMLLCVLVLATGSGLSIAKMVCLKSGYTQISLNEPDDCCPHGDTRGPVTIDEKCCDISSMDIAILHYLASATQNIQKAYVAVDVPASLISFDTFDVIIGAQLREYNAPPETSSPPIRIFTKSFLI